MIFDDAPIKVNVFLIEMRSDGYGGLAPKASETPVRTSAFVQPMEIGEVSSGDASPVRYKLLMRYDPKLLRKWSKLTMAGYPGDYAVVYPPRVHRASKETTFVSAVVEGAEHYG